MLSLSELFLFLYLATCGVLLVKIWRRDAFFAAFFSALVLYSSIAQIGYLYFPELSIVGVRMYFGEEVLPIASAFTTLSFMALYAGYLKLYASAVRKTSIRTVTTHTSRPLYALLTLIQVTLLALGYLHFSSSLSYANASDEDFLAAAGLPYALFWSLFKFTTFSFVVLFAVVRQQSQKISLVWWLLVALLLAKFTAFVSIAVATGNRTDPLAAVTGVIAFEYMTLKLAGSNSRVLKRIRARSVRKKFVFFGLAVLALGLTVGLLTKLESLRGVTTEFDVDASATIQSIFLKDYYPPFHVLIGAIANDYVNPFTVLISNSANALMFLKVEYLQFFVVDMWDPGSVTRAASPAMFAFTEGFVAAGWAGWIYNGIIWSIGFALWRGLSRTDNDKFNAIAFAIPLMMIMVTARCQSSYFIKTLYMSFAPALFLYSLASGVRWKAVRFGRFSLQLQLMRRVRQPVMYTADR